MRCLMMAALLSAAPAFAATVGTPAPAFTAIDATGKTVRLADFKGRPVVLEWTNAGCPFVRAHYDSGMMQASQAAARQSGAVWLTINSGAPGKQGHVDSAGATAQMAADKAAPTAYLLDADGKIGRLYDARTTPHIYVVDAAGKLAYAGAVDDRPTADIADAKAARNYARAALASVQAGKTPDPAATKPYGCSVKYK